MTSLEFLADDVTPARPTGGSTSSRKVRLTSPLRLRGTLPRLDLSPTSPQVQEAMGMPSPSPRMHDAAGAPSPPNGRDSSASKMARACPAATAVTNSTTSDEVFNELVTALRSSEATNHDLQGHLEALQGDHSKLMAHHTILTRTIADLNEQIIQDREENAQLHERLAESEKLKERLGSDKSALTEEKRRLEEALREARREAEAGKERFVLEERLCALQTQADAAAKGMQHLRRDLEEVQSERDALLAERTKLLEKQHHHESKIKQLTSTLDEAQEAARAATAACATQTDELRKRMKMHRNAQKACEELKAQLLVSGAEIQKKYKQLTDIASDIEKLALHLSGEGCRGFIAGVNPRAHLKWISHCLNELLTASADERLRHVGDAQELHRQLSSTAEERDALIKTNSTLEDELRNVRAAFAQSKVDLERIETDYKQERAELMLKLEKAVASGTAAEQHASRQEFICAELQAEVEDLRLRVPSLTQTAAELRSEVEAADSKSRRLEEDLARSWAQQHELERRLTTTNQQLDSKTDDAARLKQDNAKLAAHKEWSTRELQKMKRKVEEASAAAAAGTELASHIKLFITRHGGDTTSSIQLALESMSTKMIADSNERFGLLRQIAEQTERVVFLEQEVNLLRSPPSFSEGRPTVASAAAFISPPQAAKSQHRTAMILTPKERRLQVH